jgi:hypothetical protein
MTMPLAFGILKTSTSGSMGQYCIRTANPQSGMGGDNSNWSAGTFFEGATTAGRPSDATQAGARGTLCSGVHTCAFVDAQPSTEGAPAHGIPVVGAFSFPHDQSDGPCVTVCSPDKRGAPANHAGGSPTARGMHMKEPTPRHSVGQVWIRRRVGRETTRSTRGKLCRLEGGLYDEEFRLAGSEK